MGDTRFVTGNTDAISIYPEISDRRTPKRVITTVMDERAIDAVTVDKRSENGDWDQWVSARDRVWCDAAVSSVCIGDIGI